jgi:lipocalin
MNKLVAFLAVCATLIIFSQIPQTEDYQLSRDPPLTVPYVNLTRYLGTWYEQALIPFFWERNCERSSATYSFNSDQSIRVDNVCYRNGVKK